MDFDTTLPEEGIRLLRAFLKIKDSETRRRLTTLAELLAANEIPFGDAEIAEFVEGSNKLN